MSLPLTKSEMPGADRSPISDSATWNLEAAQQVADPGVAKRAFLRMVSHELRTPLNSIIGFSEILRQELYGPLGSAQYVEYANIIKDSGTKLLGLFNNFIEIVRLEGGGGLTVSSEPVLHALEEAVAKTRTVAATRGVRVEIGLRNEDLHAMFDPRGLASCLDQLLKNAIDFTASGDVIEINARPVNDKVDISIFNRGNAPDQSDVERLMLPFEQGDAAINRSHEGAGLGWAIVKLNAEAMGGAFGVMSRKGEALKAIVRLNKA